MACGNLNDFFHISGILKLVEWYSCPFLKRIDHMLHKFLIQHTDFQKNLKKYSMISKLQLLGQFEFFSAHIFRKQLSF